MDARPTASWKVNGWMDAGEMCVIRRIPLDHRREVNVSIYTVADPLDESGMPFRHFLPFCRAAQSQAKQTGCWRWESRQIAGFPKRNQMVTFSSFVHFLELAIGWIDSLC